MLHKIPQVLNPEELNAVRRVLEQSEFVDGKLTAGVGAGNVKFNEELGRDTPQKEPLAQIIIGALYRKQLFQQVAVGWVQSMVRDPAQRELLYDLARAREKLVLNHPEEEETHLVDHALINLTRMWSDV